MISPDIQIQADAVQGMPVDVSLDGRTFRMLSSTTSEVDLAEPTVFRYSEREGVLWGDYSGDTVIEGRFAGVREGETVRLSYNHRSKSGALTHGNAVTEISRVDDGKLRLTEFYRNGEGDPALSFCEEISEQ